MQTFLMLAILLSLVASLILLLVFHDMKIDNRKWHMNIAIFVFLFLLVNALAYSYEAERGKPAYFQMPDVSLWIWWCIVGVIDGLLIWEGFWLHRTRKEKIRQNSIKEAMNVLPIGICYFTEDGYVKLCNEQMYRHNAHTGTVPLLIPLAFANLCERLFEIGDTSVHCKVSHIHLL